MMTPAQVKLAFEMLTRQERLIEHRAKALNGEPDSLFELLYRYDLWLKVGPEIGAIITRELEIIGARIEDDLERLNVRESQAPQ